MRGLCMYGISKHLLIHTDWVLYRTSHSSSLYGAVNIHPQGDSTCRPITRKGTLQFAKGRHQSLCGTASSSKVILIQQIKHFLLLLQNQKFRPHVHKTHT
jgi:hypothetical protein